MTNKPPHDRRTARLAAEKEVLRYAREHPEFGQAHVAEALRAAGFNISPSGVRYLWQEHGLETTYKRLKALERSSGPEFELSPNQREFLRRGDVSRKLARKTQRRTVAGSAETEATAERRQLILAAAAQLFGERGYNGASVRDLAQQVGLLPGSVYHHFPSKEELFVEVHREGFRQLIADVEAAIGREADPWRRLELACTAHIHALVEGNSISTVTGVSLFSLHEPRLKRRLQGDRDRYEEIFVRLIGDLELPGGIDRTLLRMFLFGALNWTLIWFRPGKKKPQEIARQMVTMIRGH
ncbi:MAG: hypothetical protein A3H93_00790 [Rhodocyclales bacterium RIFCSPLOWO2_02_FULL_63_24]|nr:MAG: hypothetical protein A3H93_00790 [Rhodocyclales bacterium RIFCSPLOWO2_02_FULL_63_24]